MYPSKDIELQRNFGLWLVSVRIEDPVCPLPVLFTPWTVAPQTQLRLGELVIANLAIKLWLLLLAHNILGRIPTDFSRGRNAVLLSALSSCNLLV